MDYNRSVRVKIRRNIRTQYQMIRSLGIAFFIPFLVNDLLIPLGVYLCHKSYGADEQTYSFLIRYVQSFTPFFSTIWIYMHLVKYIDLKGNEIFYLVHRMKRKEILFLFLLYVLTNTIPFLWYVTIFPKVYMEWIHIVIVSFFLVSMAYFMCYLIKSVAIAILPVLCYTFLSVIQGEGKSYLWSFYEQGGMEMFDFTHKYLCFLFLGMIFFWLGSFLNKIYTDY